jgi:hypothetical protein
MTAQMNRLALLALMLLAGGVATFMAVRSRLWPDEIFSLAVASGNRASRCALSRRLAAVS